MSENKSVLQEIIDEINANGSNLTKKEKAKFIDSLGGCEDEMLNPCAVCGCEKMGIGFGYGKQPEFRIICTECYFDTGLKPTLKQAVGDWNKATDHGYDKKGVKRCPICASEMTGTAYPAFMFKQTRRLIEYTTFCSNCGASAGSAKDPKAFEKRWIAENNKKIQK